MNDVRIGLFLKVIKENCEHIEGLYDEKRLKGMKKIREFSKEKMTSRETIESYVTNIHHVVSLKTWVSFLSFHYP